MKIPESWLRVWCNPPLNTQQLADALTMGGFEVESLKPVGPPFTGVVVAEIVAAEQHPNADKLRVCQVVAGAHTRDGPLQIVCGAPNARVGIKVPLALVGAMLPPATGASEPFSIKAAKLRGVESAGMLCSGRELGLSTDHGGLLELDADQTVGQDIRAALSLDDAVLELKLTPNLGHVLSVYGVARELSALTGAPLKAPEWPTVTVQHESKLTVHIKDIDLCGRFSGRLIHGVNAKASTPAWMVQRLARCGQRSVNALVDISNYVMFEFGRPSHIFDSDAIQAPLEVRWGRAGESLELLNGQTITVDTAMGVIADARGPESLAGIMGGQATATSDTTQNVYVEAAHWHPEAIAGRPRKLGLNTDAGHRFERGVDPSTTVQHVEYLTRLIQDICGGRAGPVDDQVRAVPARKPVTLRVARAAQIIGMPLTLAQCADVFTRMGLSFSSVDAPDGGTLTVTPPTWRFDLLIEEDLIEEIARVVGFSALPDTPTVSSIAPKPRTELHRPVHALRHRAAALGYQEAITYSFVDPAWERDWMGDSHPIKVLNPIASNLAVMRTTLLGSLLDALQHNVARRAPRVRLFEVGRVYLRNPSAQEADTAVPGIDQPMRFAALAYGDVASAQWGEAARIVDLYDLKGDLESLAAPAAVVLEAAEHPMLHPGRSARVRIASADGLTDAGWIGELHPRLRHALALPHAPVLMELDLHALMQRELPQARPVSKQQAVLRDMALVLSDRTSHAAVMAAVRQHAGPLLREVQAFDRYKPKKTGDAASDLRDDEHSLALRLTWRDDDAALTDERVDAAMAHVVQGLQQHVGARLRA
jgi:phenylalanyl-tRNA synthetase beta chain